VIEDERIAYVGPATGAAPEPTHADSVPNGLCRPVDAIAPRC
jgi:hypothetical protein